MSLLNIKTNGIYKMADIEKMITIFGLFIPTTSSGHGIEDILITVDG